MSTAATKAGDPLLSDEQIGPREVVAYHPVSGKEYPVKGPVMLPGMSAKDVRGIYEQARKQDHSTIAELRSEIEEQARLLGSGASREAALMAEVERLKKVAQVACDALVNGCLCIDEMSFPLAHNQMNYALSQLAENDITPSK